MEDFLFNRHIYNFPSNSIEVTSLSRQGRLTVHPPHSEWRSGGHHSLPKEDRGMKHIVKGASAGNETIMDEAEEMYSTFHKTPHPMPLHRPFPNMAAGQGQVAASDLTSPSLHYN